MSAFDQLADSISENIDNPSALYAIVKGNADIICASLRGYVQESGWIPVSERMPKRQQVILLTDGDIYSSGFWDGDWLIDVYDASDGAVIIPTHWMPMPQFISGGGACKT